MLKVGLVGKAGAGKTTLANYLKDSYGFEVLSLASPIKEMEKDIENNVPFIDIYDKHIHPYYPLDRMQIAMVIQIFNRAKSIPREHPKPRKRLQYLGTDGFRNNIDSSFWIKLAEARANNLSDVPGAVIEDIRFVNEYTNFSANGWRLIKIKISPAEQRRRLESLYGELDESILEHPSEKEVDLIFQLLEKHPFIDNNQELDIVTKELCKLLRLT